MKKLILCCGIIVLIFVGCGKDDSDGDSGDNNGEGGNGSGFPGGPTGSGEANAWPPVFVKPADLEAGPNLETYSKSSVIYFMSDSAFYAHKPQNKAQRASQNDSEDGSDWVSCYIEKYQNMKFKAVGDYLYVDEELDLSDCEEKLMLGLLDMYYGDNDLKIEEKIFTQKTKFFTMLKCENGDFKQFDGKTLKEASEMTDDWDENYMETLCPKEGKRELISNSKATVYHKYSYSYVENSNRVSMTAESEDRTLSAEMTAKGKSCVVNINDGVVAKEDGCIALEKRQHIINKENDVEKEDMGKEEYSRIEYKGITEVPDTSAVWYSSGQIMFQKGDWKGTVTYKDKDTAPTYKMTNGTESAEGQLNSTF